MSTKIINENPLYVYSSSDDYEHIEYITINMDNTSLNNNQGNAPQHFVVGDTDSDNKIMEGFLDLIRENHMDQVVNVYKSSTIDGHYFAHINHSDMDKFECVMDAVMEYHIDLFKIYGEKYTFFVLPIPSNFDIEEITKTKRLKKVL